MNFEFLPNEIFLDLFNYFNGIELLRIFYGLNYRFNCLLYNQFRLYYFRFNCVSKRIVDMICKQHLPFIADRIISLHLSDYRQTVGQINLFFSYIPSFKQFTRLRSLTISCLHSYEILLKLLNGCHHFNSLTHLNLSYCSFSNVEVDFQLIVNTIWSLQKLTHCHFGINIKNQNVFCLPTIISSSLECLCIADNKLIWNQINQLFDYTPRLRYLSATYDTVIHNNYNGSPFSTLTRLNIHFFRDSVASKLNGVFEKMPNLRHLDVIIQSELINGHQWEQVIRNYLPKLKIFRFNMRNIIWFDENLEEQVNHLMDSFRSSFWIDQHQWFVRCLVRLRIVRLCRLSDPSEVCLNNFDSWKSTYPHDDQQTLYNSVTNIYDHRFLDRLISSDIHLRNITSLKIKFPMNDQIWSIVPSLNQLNSLTILSYVDTFQSQLQTLLNRSSHLCIFSISQDTSLPLQTSFFQYTNTSIRQIVLHDNNHCFNEEQCIILSCSPLAAQCEVLSIGVNKPESIIHIMKNMIKLRALIIYWNPEKEFQQTDNNDECSNTKITNLDQLVQWLKDRLPSTCLIVTDPYYDHHISIWI